MEAHAETTSPETSADEDPSADVADTRAPAHLEERGVDEQLEEQLDEGDGDE